MCMCKIVSAQYKGGEMDLFKWIIWKDKITWVMKTKMTVKQKYTLQLVLTNLIKFGDKRLSGGNACPTIQLQVLISLLLYKCLQNTQHLEQKWYTQKKVNLWNLMFI